MSSSLSIFDVIAETLADNTTYVLIDTYAERCRNGPADPAVVPDSATFAMAIDPFSSRGSASWLRDRKEGDHW